MPRHGATSSRPGFRRLGERSAGKIAGFFPLRRRGLGVGIYMETKGRRRRHFSLPAFSKLYKFSSAWPFSGLYYTVTLLFDYARRSLSLSFRPVFGKIHFIGKELENVCGKLKNLLEHAVREKQKVRASGL